MITEQQVRDLARTSGNPVTSLYLDVDGRRYPRAAAYRERLDRLVRRGSEKARMIDAEARDAARAHLDRIQARVVSGLDRSSTRGMALFAWGDRGLEVFELPRPVQDQVTFAPHPHVRQLEGILAGSNRFLVVLVDRDRARLLRLEAGSLSEPVDLIDDVPPRVDPGIWSGPRIERHSDTMAHRHVERVATAVADELRDRPVDHLVLGGAERASHELDAALPEDIRKLLAAIVAVPLTTGGEGIRRAVLEVEESIERQRDAAVFDQVREAAGTGTGVMGFDGTLRVLWEQRVDTLVVRRDFQSAGAACSACGFMITSGDSCPECGAVVEQVDDLVERAIESALDQGAAVRLGEAAHADEVGALLR